MAKMDPDQRVTITDMTLIAIYSFHTSWAHVHSIIHNYGSSICQFYLLYLFYLCIRPTAKFSPGSLLVFQTTVSQDIFYWAIEPTCTYAWWAHMHRFLSVWTRKKSCISKNINVAKLETCDGEAISISLPKAEEEPLELRCQTLLAGGLISTSSCIFLSSLSIQNHY